jgi:hypothetical protein
MAYEFWPFSGTTMVTAFAGEAANGKNWKPILRGI